MRSSWLFGALVCFIMGIIFTISILGAIIGIPLIILSVIFLFVGIIIPDKRRVINVHHHNK